MTVESKQSVSHKDFNSSAILAESGGKGCEDWERNDCFQIWGITATIIPKQTECVLNFS